MGAPILLGGGSFTVDDCATIFVEPGSNLFRPRPDPAAFTILSAVNSELRCAGYQMANVRRGKPGDVRCRCNLSDAGYVEVILVAEKTSGPLRSFLLMAWDFSKLSSPANGSQVWEALCSVADDVIQKRFHGSPLIRLNPSEIDFRAGAVM